LAPQCQHLKFDTLTLDRGLRRGCFDFNQYCEGSSGIRFALAVKSMDSVISSEQFIHFHLIGRKVIKVIAFEEQFNSRIIRQASGKVRRVDGLYGDASIQRPSAGRIRLSGRTRRSRPVGDPTCAPRVRHRRNATESNSREE
jgi:hypothetical protein